MNPFQPRLDLIGGESASAESLQQKLELADDWGHRVSQLVGRDSDEVIPSGDSLGQFCQATLRFLQDRLRKRSRLGWMRLRDSHQDLALADHVI